MPWLAAGGRSRAQRFGVKPRASGPSSPGHCRIAGAGDGDLACAAAYKPSQHAPLRSLQSRARNPRRKRPGAYADQNPRCWLCLLVACEHSSPLTLSVCPGLRGDLLYTRVVLPWPMDSLDCLSYSTGFGSRLDRDVLDHVEIDVVCTLVTMAVFRFLEKWEKKSHRIL